MPAKSISPAVRAASLAVGSSTTTMMSRASAGGPPSAAGKPESAANTQRRFASCATKRNGPFPVGCWFHAARRSSARGIESSRCAGRIARSVSTSGMPRCAWANRITTVESLGSLTNATSAKSLVPRSPPSPRSRARSSVAARPHSSGPRVVARDSAHGSAAGTPRPGRRGRRDGRGRPHVPAAAARARRSRGAAARARRHHRAGGAPAPRPGPRSPVARAVRRLARSIRARRLGTEHRDGARRARPARRRRARDPRARGAVAGLDLPPRDLGRRGPGERRSAAGHGAVRDDRNPVRAAGILARPRVDHRIHLLGARAPRVRRGRARRRRPHGMGPGRRPPAPPRAPARDADADRHRRHRPLRARRDARCPESAVRAGRAREGVGTVPRYTTTRCTKRPHSRGYAARTVPPGFVFRHGVRGGGVRLARRGTPAGRGGAGARLPRGDGRDRGQRGARRRGEFPRRRRDGLARSARPAGVERRRAMRPLLRDRRAAFGVAVLAIVAGAGLAAPLVTRGRPTAQGDIVATRFLPPLAGDHAGGFHLLGTDRFGRDVWTRLVYGARVSLAVGTLAVLLSIVLGVAVGAAAGFGPGLVQLPLLALTDFALALPRVVLLLLLAGALH